MAESPQSGAGPKVKGVAFKSIDACFLELRGAAALQRARSLMQPELRDLYANNLVLASSWYPIALYRDALRAFRAATGDGPELSRQIGYQSVKRDMRSIYKAIFVRLISPQMLLGMSSRLFSSYYDTGTFDVLESRRGSVLVRLHGCTDWDLNMWTEIQGSCVSLLEIAGAKEVRIHCKSGGKDHDTAMELEAHWV